jgi:hypothetical protein
MQRVLENERERGFFGQRVVQGVGWEADAGAGARRGRQPTCLKGVRNARSCVGQQRGKAVCTTSKTFSREKCPGQALQRPGGAAVVLVVRSSVPGCVRGGFIVRAARATRCAGC